MQVVLKLSLTVGPQSHRNPQGTTLSLKRHAWDKVSLKLTLLTLNSALEEAEQCATQNSSLLTQKELPGRPMVANIRVLLGGGGPEKQRGGWVALPGHTGSHTSWV